METRDKHRAVSGDSEAKHDDHDAELMERLNKYKEVVQADNYKDSAKGRSMDDMHWSCLCPKIIQINENTGIILSKQMGGS